MAVFRNVRSDMHDLQGGGGFRGKKGNRGGWDLSEILEFPAGKKGPLRGESRNF